MRNLSVLGCGFFLFVIFGLLWGGEWALSESENSPHGEVSGIAKKGTPKLSLGSNTFDFGSVPEGSVVEHPFVINNKGDAPLEILRTHASCGCTATVLESNIVTPGSETAIRVSLNTSGFGGYKERSVRVYTNDPTNSSFVLTLKGNVQRDVTIDPPRVYFGAVRKGSTPSSVVTVSGGSLSQVKIGDAAPRSEQLDLSVEEEGELRKSLRVTLKDTAPVGIFRSEIVVRTSSEVNPVVNIPVFARVTGDLELFPRTVSFGLHEGPLKEPLSEKVELRNTSQKDVKVVSVETSDPYITAVFNPLEEGKVYEIIVTVSSGFSGTLKGNLEILTDHPDVEQRRIELPVYGIVSVKGV